MANRHQLPLALLGFFVLLHILNHVDRNLIASFGPEVINDLGLTRTEFGIITGIAFTSVYAVMALAAGIAADRYSRTRVMACGLGIWSTFTALSGVARGFLSLALMRPLVATGEATLIPTAVAILSDRFPPARRATAIGLFFMGVPLGIGASFVIAGQLGPILGWRRTFFLLGGVGVLLALVALNLGDHRSVSEGGMPDAAGEDKRAIRDVLADLFRELRTNTDLGLCLLGSVLMHVYMAGIPFMKLWLVEDRGFRGEEIAATYGATVIVFGVLGAGLGGAAADWYARRFSGGQAMFLAVFVAMLSPLLLGFRFAEPGSFLFYAGMAAGVLFFSAFYGPAFAVLHAVTPERLHATVTGLSMLLVNVCALGLGGLAIGAASDALVAAGRADTLTAPLVAADLISMTTIICFARIGWRRRLCVSSG